VAAASYGPYANHLHLQTGNHAVPHRSIKNINIIIFKHISEFFILHKHLHKTAYKISAGTLIYDEFYKFCGGYKKIQILHKEYLIPT